MNVGDKIIELHRRLDDADIPHAFGGAIALAYCTFPARGTEDIDLNIFVDADAAQTVLVCLPEGVEIPIGAADIIRRDAQTRLWWSETPVDLFFNNVEFHLTAAKRWRMVEFGPTTIPVLSCTDLAICKALFARRKDWADIEAMVAADSLDGDDCLVWLGALVGEDDHRVVEFTKIRAETAPGPGPGDMLPPELRPGAGAKAD